MPIFYALIARNNDTVLVEANLSSGNYPQVTMKYLKSNKSGDGFKTFVSQDYVYYMYNEHPYTYLCLCESGFSKFKCLTFLKDIRDQFVRLFSDDERDNCVAYGLNQRFEGSMKERIKYYNESSDQDGRVKSLVNQLQDVQSTMQTNLDNIIQRGEKIDILMNTTKTMRTESIALNNRAKRLKDKQRWENIWKKVALGVGVIILIYIVLCAICGFPAMHKCFGDKNSNALTMLFQAKAKNSNGFMSMLEDNN